MTTLAKWSVEDYHLMIDNGILRDRAVELLEGEIIQMSAARVPSFEWSSGAAAGIIGAFPDTSIFNESWEEWK